MATQLWSLLQSHFSFVHEGFFSEFVYPSMFKIANSFWFFVSSFIISLFRFITKPLFRFLAEDDSQNGKFDHSTVNSSGKSESGNELDKEGKLELSVFKESKDFNESISETERSVFRKCATPTTTAAATSSRYQFVLNKDVSGFVEDPQTESFTIQEIFVASNEGFINPGRDSVPKPLPIKKEIMEFDKESSDSDKDQSFKSVFSVSEDHLGFSSETVGLHRENAEESAVHLELTPETVGFDEYKAEDSAIHLGFTSSTVGGFDEQKAEDSAVHLGFTSETEAVDKEKREDSAFYQGFTSETEGVGQEKTESPATYIEFNSGVYQEKTEESVIFPGYTSETEGFDEERVGECVISSCCEEALENQKLNKDEEIDSSEDKYIDKQGFLFKEQLPPDKFVLDENGNEALEPTEEEKMGYNGILSTLKGISNGDSYGKRSISDGEAFPSKDQEDDSNDECIDLEFKLQNPSECNEEFFPGKGTGQAGDLDGVETSCCNGTAPMRTLGKSEDQSSGSLHNSDSDDEDGDVVLWEHRDLIKQMRMEIKNARSGGLPTILEESETTKIIDDLKPLKIDEEKIGHKDRMAEIQKFYKSYTERMRKLDILNYQTMQAISLFQRKGPLQRIPGQTSSSSTIKLFLVQNLRPGKIGRIHADPTLKTISELLRDLELVYIGQLSLSWEILCWQYREAKELQECDSQGLYSYNQVAGEIRQFQVLVQRFVEDEKFQGPRVLNYANKRSLLRTFLQVPVIKDDCWKEKKGIIDGKTDPISIALLAVIIKEAMHVFWEFLQADKHEANVIPKHLFQTRIKLQGTANSEILINLRANIQKKEKRLKDVMKSGNFLVKTFRKQRGGGLDHEQFISQVELKLLSRVLNLSKITADQLAWCQKKLSNINLVGRRIHVEPSFLLFPC